MAPWQVFCLSIPDPPWLLAGVAWREPRDREGKFSLLHPQSGRPWFEGGLPSGAALQALQLEFLRDAELPLPAGWKLQPQPQPPLQLQLQLLPQPSSPDAEDAAGLPALSRD